MKDIIIAGIAGSGKGTQARALEEKFGDQVQYFEPGAVLRALSSNDNIVGNYAKTYTSNGLLLPDAFMGSVLSLVFASLHQGNRLLVDGFPRMHSQKKIFDDAMSAGGREFVVFHLVIDEDEAVSRLQRRMFCPSCGTTYNELLHGEIKYCPQDSTLLKRRTDDMSMEAIQARFDAFYKETKPILDEYKTEGRLIEINGQQPVEAVTLEILSHL